jgi:hypothetical protein
MIMSEEIFCFCWTLLLKTRTWIMMAGQPVGDHDYDDSNSTRHDPAAMAQPEATRRAAQAERRRPGRQLETL